MKFRTKKKIFKASLILILLSSLSFSSYEIYKIVQNKNDNNDVIIEDENEINQNFKVHLDNFNPGSKKTYTININNKLNNYNIVITATKDGKNDLSSFVDVEIKYNNDVLYSNNLDDLLNNSISINDLHNDGILYITYSIDKNVGNEAQNKESNFSLNIKFKSGDD